MGTLWIGQYSREYENTIRQRVYSIGCRRQPTFTLVRLWLMVVMRRCGELKGSLATTSTFVSNDPIASKEGLLQLVRKMMSCQAYAIVWRAGLMGRSLHTTEGESQVSIPIHYIMGVILIFRCPFRSINHHSKRHFERVAFLENRSRPIRYKTTKIQAFEAVDVISSGAICLLPCML
jgi:hypothetical protein